MGRWQELQQAMSAGVEAAIDAGWDRQAVYGLVESAIKDTRFLPLEQAKTAVTELFSEVEEVGSSAYERLFRFSAYRPQEKLSLLLWQLGAVLDQHGMLQLVGPYRFSKTIAPHATFWHLLAKTVQKAYPLGLLGSFNQEKAKKIHQLRMYIDRQNITYIRDFFKQEGDTDEQALKRYVFAAKPQGMGGRKLKKSSARLHNKYPEGASYSLINKKRLTPNFHSEFILNEEGTFVTQWDVLVEDWRGRLISNPAYYQAAKNNEYQEKVLNGESFNYANRNNRTHELLDSSPPGRFDHQLRKTAKKGWLSPRIQEYDYRRERQIKCDHYSQ